LLSHVYVCSQASDAKQSEDFTFSSLLFSWSF